jgi:hypothetical protein
LLLQKLLEAIEEVSMHGDILDGIELRLTWHLPGVLEEFKEELCQWEMDKSSLICPYLPPVMSELSAAASGVLLTALDRDYCAGQEARARRGKCA